MALLRRIISILLTPASWLYGAATALRNACYDCGLLRSRSFALPVISVGNITVGGTGKSPHVEYLLSLLGGGKDVAVVSRGYRRRTSGLVLANADSSAADIGDEPFQMMSRFPRIRIAVCASRATAIERLMQPDINPPVRAVVLDDAFQHRSVKPGLSILLTDYSRPIFSDRPFPAGMMREPFSGRLRADIVIVSKCPEGLSAAERERFAARLRLAPRQRLFFTAMRYGNPYAVFAQADGATTLAEIAARGRVVALAGIAQPQPFFDEVRSAAPEAETLRFADHHNFTPADIKRLEELAAEGAAVVTTEKDAARLHGMAGEMSARLKEKIYALPISVAFPYGGQQRLNEIILEYARQNKRGGGISRAAD